jgi:hypothetical protein
MIRSRFLFLLLLLAYVSLTPAGVYTCACFVPGEPVLPAQVALGSFSDQHQGGIRPFAPCWPFCPSLFYWPGVLNL